MSKICDICQKTYNKGNLVPRGIGNRVTRRTSCHQKANLRNKKLIIGNTKIRATVCASCLKRLKKDGVIPSYS
ncbi:50S ribosomal protein L28 [Patescibacteria group bacterium]|nr:50S ribosomal protein L28 [Patescibacteria group bacterium]